MKRTNLYRSLTLNVFDFNVQYVPSYKKDSIGIVIYSNPEFGKIVKKGTMIDLKVLGLEESYPIPDLKFKSKSVALNILKHEHWGPWENTGAKR